MRLLNNCIRVIVLVAIMLIIAVVSYCYEVETHSLITENSFNNALMTKDFLKSIGYLSTDTLTYGATTQTAVKWIKLGSVKEDDTFAFELGGENFRYLHHFYDPVNDRGLDFYLAILGQPYFHVTGQKAPDWALEDNGSYPTQFYSVQHARQYYYAGLTANTKTDKEENLAKTLRSLGQIMHILQDMAQPQHTRNDAHGGDILGTPYGPQMFGTKSQYELYVNAGKRINTFNYLPPYPVAFDSYRKFYVTADAKGMANFSNSNFVTDGTNFRCLQANPGCQGGYPNPVLNVASQHDVSANQLEDVPPTVTGNVTFFGNTFTDNYSGQTITNDRMTTYSLFDRDLESQGKDPAFSLNKANYKAMADILLPRAVGYSAGLLNYFFRGTLTITTAPGDITFRSVKVTAANSTPSEAMGVGDVSLVIRYKALTETGLGGGKFLLNNPSADYSYKVIMLPSKVDMSTSQTLTFDFSADPLPINFADMTMQLVYKGKLGNEDGAVAVSSPTVIDGIYSDFALSLPPSGVYAKVSGDSLNGTFNELRVTATSNIPGGLSGGTIVLSIEHQVATSDPFQSLPIDTEPANAAAYIIKVPEKNGVNSLAQGVPVELVFDLTSSPLLIIATDVYINVQYLNSATSKPEAIGFIDISEPTPVDVFNNADKICINKQWYTAGSTEAVALADSNNNGIPDLFDPYAHNIANIFAKESSSVNATLASSSNFTFQSPDMLAGGSFRRLGYILTDYDFKYSLKEDWIDVTPAVDPWESYGIEKINPGTAVRNQTDADGIYTYPLMFNMRGYKMWWGASYTFVNTENEDTECGWSKL